MGTLIKQNEMYYDASTDTLNIETGEYSPIGDSSDNIDELMLLSNFNIDDFKRLTYTYGDTTNRSPIMTSSTTPSPYSVSSSSEDSDYFCWKAFNNTNSSYRDCWKTKSNVNTGWIMIDMGGEISINFISMTCQNYSDLSTAPKSFSIEISNNGLDFTLLKTIIDQTNWKANETRNFELDAPFTCRFVRINITSVNGGTSVAIGNIGLLHKDVLKVDSPSFKFDNYSLISDHEIALVVNGIKSNKEMVITSNAIGIKADLVNQIESIQVKSRGLVKFIFSLNNGLTWMSYVNNMFTTLPLEIPSRDYDVLDSDERQIWHEATGIISLDGVDGSQLSLVPFRELDISSIQFACVVNRENYYDNSYMGEILLQFTTLGHLSKMHKSEYNAFMYSHGMKIESLINTPIIKINSLLRETPKNNVTDNRIALATPVIRISHIDSVVTLNWDIVEKADYYKVYSNGILVETCYSTSSTFTIDDTSGIYLFCIRAHNTDVLKYKPSEFSNFKSLDFNGYLSAIDEASGDYKYVAIKVGNRLLKYKV